MSFSVPLIYALVSYPGNPLEGTSDVSKEMSFQSIPRVGEWILTGKNPLVVDCVIYKPDLDSELESVKGSSVPHCKPSIMLRHPTADEGIALKSLFGA